MNDWNTLTAPPSPGPLSQPTHVGNIPEHNNEAAPVALDKAILERLAAERLPQNADGVLMLWERTKKTLEAAKSDEMDLRKLAVAVFVPKPQEGMNNVDLGNGFTLKATVKYNYGLRVPEGSKKDIVDEVDDVIDEIAKCGNEGAFIAERLFSWKVDISVSEYKKLVEEAPQSIAKTQMLAFVGRVLEITNAAPTLAIKEPKAKK